jgi:hypothetical protein
MSEQAAPPMPQPTAEHKLLMEHVGNWKVACKFYMDPSQPPMETNATERIDKIGEFWTVSRYETEMMGAPFVGSCTLGYEPQSGKFVSTWVDSMMPVFCKFTGKQKGDTIHYEGEFFSCMTNSVLKHRATEKHLNKNERVFEMFCTLPDGTEIKMMTNHYRRA